MRISREVIAHWGQAATDLELSADLIPPRNYAGLHLQDDQLRIWLPDPARIALMEICNRLGMSVTAYLTELFATYMYGIHEVMRMRDHQTGLYDIENVQFLEADPMNGRQLEDDDLDIDFDDPIPELGKNIFAIKIFVPVKLKTGLQQRANLARVSLGKFTRSMICAHLFGRDIGPKFLMASTDLAK